MHISVLLLLVVLTSLCLGDEVQRTEKTAQAEPKKKIPAWLRYCDEKSSRYEIYPASKSKDMFRRFPNPVMLHTQPVRGDQLGAVYLWTTKTGRPVAIGTTIVAPETWAAGDTHYVVEEFHSLHDKPIRGRLGDMIWNCPEPGLEWKKLESAKAPQGKFTALTAQARRLAREFSAQAIDHRAENQLRPLRIQPNPIYKYQLEAATDASAGFVFAGCLATDPEVILCLESRKSSAGYQWYYAFAWFSDMRVLVAHKGEPIWENPTSWGRAHTGGKTVSGLVLPD